MSQDIEIPKTNGETPTEAPANDGKGFGLPQLKESRRKEGKHGQLDEQTIIDLVPKETYSSEDKCWYCHGGPGTDDESHLWLHRFCKCDDDRKWAHIHCLSWHLMSTLDMECPQCHCLYKNYRICRLNRGTLGYYVKDTFSTGINYWPWTGLVLGILSIVYCMASIYDDAKGFSDGIRQWSTTPTKWKVFLSLIWNGFNVVFVPVKFVVWDYLYWSWSVGKYVVFNDYTDTQNRLIAYHIRETKILRRRWPIDEDHIKSWFDRQSKSNPPYDEYETDEPKYDPFHLFRGGRWKFWRWHIHRVGMYRIART